MTTEKTCRRCHALKPAGEFKLHPETGDGLQAWCDACKRKGYLTAPERLRLAVCERCELPFAYEKQRGDGRRYCSPACRLTVKVRPPRSCAWCDADFLPRDRAGKQKYCTEKCREASKGGGRYGLSIPEYRALISTGVCAACGKPARGRMSIDHCHDTGLVRGWVHQSCNLALAQASHDVRVLRSWIAYLESHDQQSLAVAS